MYAIPSGNEIQKRLPEFHSEEKKKEGKILSGQGMPLREPESISCHVIQDKSIDLVCTLRDFVPYSRLWNIDAFYACLSGAEAIIALFGIAEELRVKQANAINGRSSYQKANPL